LSEGYVISIGRSAIYIGYHTSALAGKILVISNLSNSSYSSTASITKFSSSYSDAFSTYSTCSYIFLENGTTYYNAPLITLIPTTSIV
jgi:hypothetical protein